MAVADESVLARWHFALYRSDCLRLKILLGTHPALVLEGWKDDRKRELSGIVVEHGEARDYWNGKTALHAAARRGCLELVTAVINLFSCNHEGEWFLESNDVDFSVAPTLGNLLAAKDGEFKMEPFAIAAIYGCQGITEALAKASLKCKSNPYGIPGLVSIPGRNSDTLGELRRITEEVMGNLTILERSTIENHYSLDTTFGNLPLRESLLAHIFSNTALDAQLSKKVQVEILGRVHPGSGWEFTLYRFLFDSLGPERRVVEKVSTSVAEATEVSLAIDLNEELRKVAKESMMSLSIEDRIRLQLCYFANEDFNFLDMEEYLSMSLFTLYDPVYLEIRSNVLDDLWKRIHAHSNSRELKRFAMLDLRDGRARSALHVACGSRHSSSVREFLSLVPDGEEYVDWVNPRDGVGRTPLYMAAASGKSKALSELLKDKRVDVNKGVDMTKYLVGFEQSVSERNGFGISNLRLSSEFTVIQIAIILGKEKCVQVLLEQANGLDLTREYQFMSDEQWFRLGPEYQIMGDEQWFRLGPEYQIMGDEQWFRLGPLELAVWMGNAKTVQLLLKDPRVPDLGRTMKFGIKLAPYGRYEGKMPALHHAAMLGKFDVVKVFLDMKEIDKLYDPFVRDYQGNTTMHHVTGGKDHFFPYHLFHLVELSQASDYAHMQAIYQTEDDATKDRKKFIERQGCVELLLQAGLDLWTPNNQDEAPYPKQTSPEFLSWWYGKLGKETLEEQSNLYAAANAISVTAALVATTSYIGPLQPPLSYESNDAGLPIQLQMANVWVRMFISCDTLSFYLAVGAIMLAIIPSLPIPQQRVRMEIKHTRRIVTFAVGFLFPSIILILLAFTASSAAVIPQNRYRGLKISTNLVGGSLCLLVICVFSIRILGLVMHQNSKIKKLYGDSIFLDELVPKKWEQSTIGKRIEIWKDWIQREIRHM